MAAAGRTARCSVRLATAGRAGHADSSTKDTGGECKCSFLFLQPSFVPPQIGISTPSTTVPCHHRDSCAATIVSLRRRDTGRSTELGAVFRRVGGSAGKRSGC